MTIEFDMFYGDKMQNDFMHACDVFERGKQLGTFSPFSMELTIEVGKEEKVRENIQKIFDHFVEATKEKYNLIFVSIRKIDGEPTNEFQPYLKEGVQTISNGHGYGMFHEMLKKIGYEVEHSQYMEVTEAKLIIE